MNETQLSDYLDKQTLLERYPQLKKGQVDWLIVRKDENGLAPAIKRIGRRLYFHIPTLLKWVSEQHA